MRGAARPHPLRGQRGDLRSDPVPTERRPGAAGGYPDSTVLRVARHSVGKGDLAIGIAFNESKPGSVSVGELAAFDAANWTADDDERAAKQKAEMNYDRFSATHQVEELEYPAEE